jgi:hypothetical protein
LNKIHLPNGKRFDSHRNEERAPALGFPRARDESKLVHVLEELGVVADLFEPAD